MHSGLQLGGIPIKFSEQAHIGVLLMLWQIELGPQGDGVHGLTSSAGLSEISDFIICIIRSR